MESQAKKYRWPLLAEKKAMKKILSSEPPERARHADTVTLAQNGERVNCVIVRHQVYKNLLQQQ